MRPHMDIALEFCPRATHLLLVRDLLRDFLQQRRNLGSQLRDGGMILPTLGYPLPHYRICTIQYAQLMRRRTSRERSDYDINDLRPVDLGCSAELGDGVDLDGVLARE